MTQAPQEFPSIEQLLRRMGVWLQKRKSQHFLRRQETCMEIAQLAGLGADDLAIEVGAGAGNLTVELAARAGKVLSVEMDSTFAEWHGYLAASYPSLEFVYSDFLALDLEEIVGKYRLGGRVAGIGNLPYQVTSEILFRFVDAVTTFDVLVFMVQKEVAERIAAGPGNRSAGALTYKIALRYNARIAMRVPPGAFLPPPKVDSAVIVLEPLAEPFVQSPDHRKRVYRLLDKLFTFRRKTIANGLIHGGLVESRDEAEHAIEKAGLDAKARPEKLSLQEVLALEKAVS